jgi:iron complex outermembrane receptor protein
MPNDHLSVFATYTNSFAANTGNTSSELGTVNTTGTAADVLTRVQNIARQGIRPTTIDQYEIGAKKNLWNNMVAVNLSLYQIDYNNYYQTYWYQNVAGEIISPDSTLKEFAGRMRSRGVELDITGNPTKNLSIIGGISYNNAVYLDTPEKGFVEKQRLVRTPSTTANASVFYKFTEKLAGLKIGAGAYYIGGRLAGWNDSKSTEISRKGVSRILELDDYTTVSFSLGYDWKKFSVQGKVGNIFNAENYNVHENYSVNPITPRNYYLTLSYKL